MPNMIKLALLTAATLALAAMTNTASQAASNHGQATATDFSSQQKKGNGKPQGHPQGHPHPSGGGQPQFKQTNHPHNNGPRPSFSRNNNNNNNRNFKQHTGPQNFRKNTAGPRTFTPGPNAKTITSHTHFRGLSPRGASSASIRGRNFSVWRGGGYRVRRGGGWRTFVALGTLGALAIGGVSYYPYAYIAAPQDYCDGLTEDGCELSWQDVETIEGDIIGQCVAYCPWQ